MGVSLNFLNIDPISLKEEEIKRWIQNTIDSKGGLIGEINLIFSNDEYILEINNKYLNHDYYTDIITFDYSEYDYKTNKKKISGDLYISVDMVEYNAVEYGEGFERELYRVIIHGILHLLGIRDETEEEKAEMRKAEDECLRDMI